MWTRMFEHCEVCGRNDRPHMARGRCQVCYAKEYREGHREKIRAKQYAWYDAHPGFSRQQREQMHFAGRRVDALVRDGDTCQECGEADLEQLVVYHIDGQGRGSLVANNALENLRVLCRSCHQRVHRVCGRWSLRFDRCQRCKTTDEPHNARGFCRRCYAKWSYEQRHGA